MAMWSKRSLTPPEKKRLFSLLHAEGVEPPKVGFCVRALGGEVCRHPKYQHDPEDTGFQVININVDLSRSSLPPTKYFSRESGMKLHPPFIITSRLLPGVRVGDGTISIEYADRPGERGRQRFQYYIDAPGIEYENDDLTGIGDLQHAMGDLLAFLGAAAESYSYRMRHNDNEPGENEDLFPPDVVKWAAKHEDDISITQSEIEDADEDLIEE